MNLLAGRFAPITECIGFLEADFERVVAADAEWRGRLTGYAGRAVSGTLAILLAGLPPFTMPPVRQLWVRTTGDWTAYFDNSTLGSDPVSAVGYLSRQLRCRGVVIRCRNGTPRRGAVTEILLYGPEPTDWLNLVRIVSVSQDNGRWKWSIMGGEQSFENAAAYQRRRIRERFTPDLLSRYCAALGIRAFDESYYGTDGRLVESVGVRVESRNLEQARAWHGLPPLSDSGS